MNKHAGSERNLTLVMDLYELTMAYNYFKQGNKDQLVYFDMFYRKNPDNGGFAVFAGLQQLIECIKNLHFSEGDIEYLRSLQKFDEDFLDYVVYKGSITIDGVSLTVAYVDKKILKVSIIPHTKESTTLLGKKVGDLVNLESDIIGKYVKRFTSLSNEDDKNKNKSKIDLDFLMKNGF